MQFQIPQFIEVEDKVFGQLTFKQFIYITGGGGICFIIYSVLPLFLAILFIVPVGAFAAALAFYKINNKPFIEIVEAAVKYAFTNKLYLWKKIDKKPEESKKEISTESRAAPSIPKMSESRLKDLSWSLDVHKKLQP